MQSNHWQQKELYDGTYVLGDLLDYHEMMAVQNENQRRMEAAIQQERG